MILNRSNLFSSRWLFSTNHKDIGILYLSSTKLPFSGKIKGRTFCVFGVTPNGLLPWDVRLKGKYFYFFFNDFNEVPFSERELLLRIRTLFRGQKPLKSVVLTTGLRSHVFLEFSEKIIPVDVTYEWVWSRQLLTGSFRLEPFMDTGNQIPRYLEEHLEISPKIFRNFNLPVEKQ